MKAHFVSILSLLLVFTNAEATGAAPVVAKINDSDLSHGVGVLEEFPRNLPIDSLERTSLSRGIEIEVLRKFHEAVEPVSRLSFRGKNARGESLSLRTGVDGIAFTSSCVTGETISLQASFESSRYSIETRGGAYSLSFQAKCGEKSKLLFEEQTAGGQVTGIWVIAGRAEQKLSSAVDMAFWQNRITFNFPAAGDYYSWGEVYVTKGYQWDVVGHEMGHAIYDLANLGGSSGGEHKIDECYTETLALSEGWASYFSGWVSLDLRDPDARFEYLVPRRAPIQIENVPADVCGKPSNEWRVTSFLWDLIDLHDDGERSEETFARVWRAMKDAGSDSIVDVVGHLRTQGFDQDLLSIAWKLNFPEAPEQVFLF